MSIYAYLSELDHGYSGSPTNGDYKHFSPSLESFTKILTFQNFAVRTFLKFEKTESLLLGNIWAILKTSVWKIWDTLKLFYILIKINEY